MQAAPAFSLSPAALLHTLPHLAYNPLHRNLVLIFQKNSAGRCDQPFFWRHLNRRKLLPRSLRETYSMTKQATPTPSRAGAEEMSSTGVAEQEAAQDAGRADLKKEHEGQKAEQKNRI